MQYTSINRLLAKVDRDFGLSELDEDDVIEWAGEALEAIGTVNQYEEHVAFVEVVNHQCQLPAGLHGIIQVAKNTCYESTTKGLCASDVVSNCNNAVPVVDSTTATCPVIIDCHGQPIVDYEFAYYRPYFDMAWSYVSFNDYMGANRCLVPIRKATGSFSDVMICELVGDDDMYRSSDSEEYAVVQGNLRFNFKEGQIGLAYLRQPLDEQGLPMIPDNISYLQALSFYVAMKVATRDFDRGRQGAQSRMNDYEAKWQWYCGQAGNNALMPKGVDEMENLMQSRNYLIPRDKQYSTFFAQHNRGRNDRYGSNR